MKKIFGIILLSGLFACSDPEIVIHGPTEGASYITEAYIWIDATITDPDGIKRVSYKIYNITYDFFPPDHPDTYELDDNQSMYAFASGYEVLITVEAEDMDGNTRSQTVMVKHE